MFRNPFMTVSRHEEILEMDRKLDREALAHAVEQSRTKGRLAAEALAERDAAIARAEAAKARFAMKHRKRDDKGHFLPETQA